MNVALLKKLIENIPDDYELCIGPKEFIVKNVEIKLDDEKIVLK